MGAGERIGGTGARALRLCGESPGQKHGMGSMDQMVPAYLLRPNCVGVFKRKKLGSISFAFFEGRNKTKNTKLDKNYLNFALYKNVYQRKLGYK